MNLRHAAALALAGWYLMAPCDDCLVKAPISQWTVKRSFDTAAQCEAANAFWRAQEHAAFNNPPKSSTDSDWWDSWMALLPYSFGTCVATDDPRLKEK